MNDIDATELGAENRPRPWGFWATLGWAILATVLSAVIAILAVLWKRPNFLSVPADLMNDGQLLSFTIAISDAIQIGALAFVARFGALASGKIPRPCPSERT